jgi:hypothetical protein
LTTSTKSRAEINSHSEFDRHREVIVIDSDSSDDGITNSASSTNQKTKQKSISRTLNFSAPISNGLRLNTTSSNASFKELFPAITLSSSSTTSCNANSNLYTASTSNVIGIETSSQSLFPDFNPIESDNDSDLPSIEEFFKQHFELEKLSKRQIEKLPGLTLWIFKCLIELASTFKEMETMRQVREKDHHFQVPTISGSTNLKEHHRRYYSSLKYCYRINFFIGHHHSIVQLVLMLSILLKNFHSQKVKPLTRALAPHVRKNKKDFSVI